MLGFEFQTSGLGGQCLTTRLTWQVIVKNVKVCAQQSMSKHLQVGSEFYQYGKKSNKYVSQYLIQEYC